MDFTAPEHSRGKNFPSSQLSASHAGTCLSEPWVPFLLMKKEGEIPKPNPWFTAYFKLLKISMIMSLIQQANEKSLYP